jgi:hypothetical protein
MADQWALKGGQMGGLHQGVIRSGCLPEYFQKDLIAPGVNGAGARARLSQLQRVKGTDPDSLDPQPQGQSPCGGNGNANAREIARTNAHANRSEILKGDARLRKKGQAKPQEPLCLSLGHRLHGALQHLIARNQSSRAMRG